MIDNNFAGLPSVLKDTSKVYEQISTKLREAKVSLDNVRKKQLCDRETLGRLKADKLRSERQLYCLEALSFNLSNEIDVTEKKNEELLRKISTIIWSQNKADLIKRSEKRAYERKEAVIKSFITENNNQEVESLKSCSNNAKEREEKSKLMLEEKNILEAELNAINLTIEKTAGEIAIIEQENKVLQKRNSALLLRLQKLLKETENKRNQIRASLERVRQEKLTNCEN